MPNGSQYNIQVVSDSLDVLNAVGSGQEPLGLGEVAASLKLDKSKVFRILETLKAAGYVEQYEQSKKYCIGLSVARLRNMSRNHFTLETFASRCLNDLAVNLAASTSLGSLDGTFVRYLARVPVRRLISANIEVGTLLPAHVTSMGKVLLSGLSNERIRELYAGQQLTAHTKNGITSVDSLIQHVERVRSDGFAEAKEELAHSLNGLAAPVVVNSSVVAALSVSFMRDDDLQRDHAISTIVRAAGDLSNEYAAFLNVS